MNNNNWVPDIFPITNDLHSSSKLNKLYSDLSAKLLKLSSSNTKTNANNNTQNHISSHRKFKIKIIDNSTHNTNSHKQISNPIINKILYSNTIIHIPHRPATKPLPYSQNQTPSTKKRSKSAQYLSNKTQKLSKPIVLYESNLLQRNKKWEQIKRSKIFSESLRITNNEEFLKKQKLRRKLQKSGHAKSATNFDPFHSERILKTQNQYRKCMQLIQNLHSKIEQISPIKPKKVRFVLPPKENNFL